MQKQHVEISQLLEPVTVSVTASDHAAEGSEAIPAGTEAPAPTAAPAVRETFPAGSWVIRMDQPFSRVADALLDRQYWSPEDPQKHPYDDTAWSFSLLFNARVTRVVDPSVLGARMSPVLSPVVSLTETGTPPGGDLLAINNTGQIGLLSLAYAIPGAQISLLDEPFTTGTNTLSAGSLVIRNTDNAKLAAALARLDLQATALPAMPNVRMHALDHLPRIAMMHTWLATQTEGWWREALDSLGVPYTYINTQTVAAETDLRSKYDVILFAPVTGHTPARQIIDGMPMYGNPLPWQTTALTPNLGRIDETADMRPGLGDAGVEHLRAFVRAGGLLITAEDSAEFAIDAGLAPGVSVAPAGNVRLTGSILAALPVTTHSPVLDGYAGMLPVYSESGLAFNVSNVTAGGGRFATEKSTHRVTGRGGPEEQDQPEDRTPQPLPPLPNPKPWQATPLNEEQARNNPFVIPAAQRPQVLLRFADAKQLLLSGLLDNPEPVAAHAAVVDARLGDGHVLLFANNPIYRGETIGSYALVLNAVLFHDHMSTAPESQSKPGPGQ